MRSPYIINAICGICGLPIKKEELVWCKKCGTAYHQKCIKKRNYICPHCGSRNFVHYKLSIATVDSRALMRARIIDYEDLM